MHCAAAGVPRLFDLVKCSDEALRPAFFYALGDTVVATDLEQASRIAYGREKRWARVVTLQVCPKYVLNSWDGCKGFRACTKMPLNLYPEA